MDAVGIVRVFAEQNIFAALFVVVLVYFIYYFTKDRDKERDRYSNLETEIGKIAKNIEFIEKNTKRLEEQMAVLGEAESAMSSKITEIKVSLERISIIVQERLRRE